MKNKKKLLDALVEQKKEHGKQGLMPQNLSGDMLDMLLIEFEAVKNNEVDIPASMLLMTVLLLKSDKDPLREESVSIQFSPEELMDNFNDYGVAIILEDYRRKGKVSITESSLPTDKNIFDSNRNVQFV